MKKILIACLSGLLLSCAQDVESPVNNGKSAVHATVVDFVEEGGRTTITPTSTGMSFAWAEGDQLAIYGPSGKTMTNFDIDATTISADARSADFENCEFALRQGSTYFAVYPKDYSQLDAHVFAVDYRNQRQTSDNSTVHLAPIDYLTAAADVITDNACSFSFTHLGTIVKVTVTVNTEITLKSLTLTAENQSFTTAGTVDLTAASPSITATETSHSVTLLLGEDEDGISVSGTFTAFLLTPPINLVDDAVTLSVATDGDIYTFPLTGKNLLAGKAYGYNVNLVKHEFVDLGLPSGTKWATMNIGASTVEDYGCYFAWGETVGYPQTDLSHCFDWAHYKYCEGTSSTLTKYCKSSTYGTVDTLTELEESDDAAYMNWGENWRMPSLENYQELLSSDNTSSELTTQNGVYGRKLTSKSNGNSIFFPAAGYRSSYTLNSTGEYGYYWTRALGASASTSSKYFCFSANSVYIYGGRNYGFAVRAVAN